RRRAAGVPAAGAGAAGLGPAPAAARRPGRGPGRAAGRHRRDVAGGRSAAAAAVVARRGRVRHRLRGGRGGAPDRPRRAAPGPYGGAVKPFLAYSGGRVLLFLATALLLYAVGLRGFLLAALALLLSLPLSYVLLARQRIAFGLYVEGRIAQRKA